MGVPHVVFVVVAALLVAFAPVSGVPHWDESTTLKITSSNDKTVDRSHIDVTGDKRHLRVYGATTRDDTAGSEQRIALPTGLTQIVGAAASYIPTAQQLLLKGMLYYNKRPKDVFNMLTLNKLKLTRAENTGTALGENQALLDWLRYTVAYRTRMGNDIWYSNEKIYFKLEKLAPEVEVAKFFQILRNKPGFESVGHDLQTTQYKIWAIYQVTSPKA